jgi:hypothetical protein
MVVQNIVVSVIMNFRITNQFKRGKRRDLRDIENQKERRNKRV